MSIEPVDCFFERNAIFSDDRRLYLIDFECWRVGCSYSDLKKYYDKVDKWEAEQ